MHVIDRLETARCLLQRAGKQLEDAEGGGVDIPFHDRLEDLIGLVKNEINILEGQ